MEQKHTLSRIAAVGLGLVLAAVALGQLATPLGWYEATPGVPATGPFNPHFVRDVGAAFLTAAAGLFAFAWRPGAGRPALLMAAMFLTLHAAVHVFDAVCGPHALKDVLRDAGVYLLALMALALALTAPRQDASSQGVASC